MARIGKDSDSRLRVVRAATQQFVQNGYKSTSMKVIAQQLGISPPALYWHFPSKQELYLASMGTLLSDFVDFVASHVTASDPETKLRQFVDAHVMWKLEQRDAAGAYTASLGMRDIVHELPEKHQRVLIGHQRRHLDLLRAILDEGRDAGAFSFTDTRVASFAIVTMCEYVVTWYDPAGDYDPEAMAEMYCDLAAGMVSTANTPSARP